MRALLDADADAEIHWLGDGPSAGVPGLGAVAVVLIDLEGGDASGERDDDAIDGALVRGWVDAVSSGGHLVLAVGPRRSWRFGLDAVVASGRRWRLTAAERHGAVVHLWLQLDPPDGPSSDDAAALLDVMAGATGELSQRLIDAERGSAGMAASANGPANGVAEVPSASSLATIVPERDREIDLLRGELMRSRADLDRTRDELRKARASLDRLHRSVPGRLWRRYQALMRRVRAWRPSR